MSILVIAEHDNQTIKSATLNTVTAALQCGDDVHVLVAGSNAKAAADAAAQIAGVKKVLLADAAYFGDGLAENIADEVVSIAGNYSHIKKTIKQKKDRGKLKEKKAELKTRNKK